MKIKQRKDEWIDKGKVRTDYHERQFREPYRGTVSVCNWLEKLGFINSDSRLTILDLCSGMGANIYYMSKRYPHSTFLGVDINPDFVKKGNNFFQNNGIKNCRLEVGDIYDLNAKYIGNFHGVISFQTLSWLPEFRSPIDVMTKLAPRWIAITSLFYDGQASCTVEVTEYDDSLEPHRNYFSNIYSLPIVMKYLKSMGYVDPQVKSYEIDIDLPKPNKNIMGTYTEKLESGHKLQISGPLLMPWYFIAARK